MRAIRYGGVAQTFKEEISLNMFQSAMRAIRYGARCRRTTDRKKSLFQSAMRAIRYGGKIN